MLASKNKTSSTTQVHFTSSNKSNGSVRVISGTSIPTKPTRIRWYWRLFNWIQRQF